MKKEIAILLSLNTKKLLETVHGRNNHTNKLLIWKDSFERYLSWNYCFFLCLTKPTYTQATNVFLILQLNSRRKNLLAYKPTEENYLKLDRPTGLLSFTVTKSLNFWIPPNCFLEKFAIWKCNEKFWISWNLGI